jgi:LuxR family maltose regulon positive regulatory protein
MDPPLPLPLHRYRLAGALAEIRASDLAFTVPEAGGLLARHGITLPAGALECLTERTEGWAAGLRLAAISMGTRPNPGQFVTELITDNSALTSYLAAEALNTQPPEARDVLLSTSILEQVSEQAASELTGNEQAPAILRAVAQSNGFVQPTKSGWYRYQTLFAEVLRLKLSREYPDRRAALHRRAAQWYERHGHLTDGVRHAAENRRLAARRQHRHRRAGDQRGHRASGRPEPGRGVRVHASRSGLDRAAAAPGIGCGRAVRWPTRGFRRRAGCRRGYLGASSR